MIDCNKHVFDLFHRKLYDVLVKDEAYRQPGSFTKAKGGK